ncbi:hypothetical protein [Cohnella faecalis]|uniref:hypothetical protein n=1 Tax=Cohnella faecalis TaxID=2315694 RepID=UPI0011C2144A|nr:hypothetical protein [Cohnella faecalis]
METNALYNLANQLELIRPRGIKAYTSFFTVLELLAGIVDTNSYIKRKSILNKLHKSKIDIHWKTPTKVLYDSFGLPYDDSIDIRIVEDMYMRVLESDSYDEFIRAAEKGGDSGKIQSYDKTLSNFGVETSKLFIDSFSKNNSKDRKKEYRKAMFEDKLLHAQAQVNSEILVREHIIDMTGFSPANEYEQYIKVAMAYDRSLKVYFYAEAFHRLLSTVKGEPYGKNDIADHFHLLYISGSTAIVSDDGLLTSLAEGSRIYVCKTAAEFRKMINEA